MNKSKNPSAIQSKKWLIKSLIDLMQIKKYSDITIGEIAENAGLVRRTFYRNFNSKEEILEYFSDLLVVEFTDDVDKLGEEVTCDLTLNILFRLCYKYKGFLFALDRSNMLRFLLDKWSIALPLLHSLFLDRIKKFPQTKTEKSLEYLLTFNVGGTFNMIVKWVNEGMTLTPEQLTEIVKEFAFGTLVSE